MKHSELRHQPRHVNPRIQETRNEIVDIAKGIAIYLVVVGHLQFSSYNASTVLIASCHMPVFFFLSGIFFRKSYDKYTATQFIYNKIKTLLVPYIVWSAVAFVVNAVLMMKRGQTDELLIEAYDIFINARSVWFLIGLFLTSVVVYIIYYVTGNNHILSPIICVIAWGLLLLCGRIETFSIYKIQWLLPYYLMGIIASYQGRVFSLFERISNQRVFKRLLLTIVSAIAYVLCVFKICRVDLFYEYYVKFDLDANHTVYYLLFYVIGVIGIFVVLETAGILAHIPRLKDMVKNLGLYSLDVYVIHMFLVKVLCVFLESNQMPNWTKTQFALAIYAFILTGILTVTIKKVLRRNRLYCVTLGEK